ncbi:MAG TPA: ATP-binding protein [Candidatus Omnitrophota bacterium]|nr:ATP-binding protein [Candidatus Omnitrophota bacterium]
MDLSRLNPFAISGLLIAFAYFPLFILILINNKSKLSIVYSFHILSIAMWGIGSFFIGINTSQNFSFTIWKIAYPSALFIAVFFLHSVLILIKKERKILLIAIYGQAFYFLYTIVNNKMFPTTKFMFNSFYYHQGSAYYTLSFITWLTVVSAGYFLLIKYWKNVYVEQKSQILGLILSCIGFAGGTLDFLPGYGINIYPYGNFAILVPPFIITHIIFKYHFLDINIVIKKSIVYSVLITIISFLYFLAIILFENFLKGIVGYKSLILSVSISFVIGIIFFPLRNFINLIIDRIFFHGTHEEIMKENERLKQEVEQTEKLKSISILASGIAHEIKNPLTAIKTFAEYLPRKMNDKEFLSNFSRIVGHEVERIDNLVHELLEFAKPSPLQLKEVDLASLIDNTLAFLSSKFIKHSITVDQNYSPSANIRLTADANRLRQAFLNIFINAIDAMNRGGRLSVSVDRVNDHVRLSIEDTGTGIAKKDLKNVFDPFYTKKDHGVGLGLSITQRIIKDHGGKILVESKPGVGTKFIVELPGKKKKR